MVNSPLINACHDTTKQTAASGIVQWYRDELGVTIANEDFYFFDDRADNVKPWQGLGYNAHQISCKSRSPSESEHPWASVLGLCGATQSEITDKKGISTCEFASPPAPPTSPAPGPSKRTCLCAFDIDRTLTGRQESTAECPNDSPISGVHDHAYLSLLPNRKKDTLMLSDALEHLPSTFCSACYIGVITAGSRVRHLQDIGPMNEILVKKLNASGGLPTATWNPAGCTMVNSPLINACHDTTKQTAASGIVQWYRDELGVTIANEDFYFFDDRADNVKPWQGLGYNAHQISCKSRSPSESEHPWASVLGLCGATQSEITDKKGISTCETVVMV